MQKYAREIENPNYNQAAAFSRNCEALAVEAANIRTRDELGVRFDPNAAETVNRIRENREMIVRAHVCALAADRPLKRCTPLK
jgi:hypothetical protein